MSRIGKKPVVIPKGVQIKKDERFVRVKGPKGELSLTLHPNVNFEIENNEVILSRASESKTDRSLHGTNRALIQNMVVGVTQGFSKKLELVGVGYRAELKGKKLQLALGYSHPIVFFPPTNVQIEVPTPTSIVISGIDKQLIGEVSAKIRSFREPEPYKGKGIKYEGEHIRRKAGKTAGKAKK